MVRHPKPSGTVCALSTKREERLLTSVGTVRNALLNAPGTVSRGTLPRPSQSAPLAPEDDGHTPIAEKPPTLPPSMSGRALPAVPSGGAGKPPVPPTASGSGTLSRKTALSAQSGTMRLAHGPDHTDEHHGGQHDEEDQMLEGVIVPALNNVSALATGRDHRG